jgi:hypothetical protein
VFTLLGPEHDEQRAIEDFRRRLIAVEMNAVAEIMAVCSLFRFCAHRHSQLPPYSFTMKMIVLFIPFLRENIKIGKTEPKQLSDFTPIWKDYWTKVVGEYSECVSSY